MLTLEQRKELSFTDLELIRSQHKVVLEWIGEGLSGDYNPEDELDVPLLRFSCYKLDSRYETMVDNNGDPVWEQVDDASYCTRLPINAPIRLLAEALAVLLDAFIDNEENGTLKKRMEELSWLWPEDFDYATEDLEWHTEGIPVRQGE